VGTGVGPWIFLQKDFLEEMLLRAECRTHKPPDIARSFRLSPWTLVLPDVACEKKDPKRKRDVTRQQKKTNFWSRAIGKKLSPLSISPFIFFHSET
jgi:hypothetical protein